MFFEIFNIFFKLGFFTFGGGYVMIPMIERELTSKGIFILPEEIANIIAVAGMSPGPVAVNAAVGFGYKIGGVSGMIAAALGVAMPCIIVVILVAVFFFKIYENTILQSALYGLRPVIVGIIAYAAVNMAINNGIFLSDNIIEKGWNYIANGVQVLELKSVAIAVGTVVLLVKTKLHPIYIILGSGILGMIIFI